MRNPQKLYKSYHALYSVSMKIERDSNTAERLAWRYLRASATEPEVARRYARLLQVRLTYHQSANDWFRFAAYELMAKENQENS